MCMDACTFKKISCSPPSSYIYYLVIHSLLVLVSKTSILIHPLLQQIVLELCVCVGMVHVCTCIVCVCVCVSAHCVSMCSVCAHPVFYM